MRYVNGIRRGQYTTDGAILDAAWCRFFGSAGTALCLLQQDCLTMVAPTGNVQTVPLLQRFQHLWPMPQAVLLTVSSDDHTASERPPNIDMRLAAASGKPCDGSGAALQLIEYMRHPATASACYSRYKQLDCAEVQTHLLVFALVRPCINARRAIQLLLKA